MTAVTVVLSVAIPALAGLAGLLLRRSRPISGLVAVGAGAVVLLLAVVQLGLTDTSVSSIGTFGPLSTGELALPLNLLADRTSAVIALAVALVGFAVQVFSVWYLQDDLRYPVFASTVSLFVAAMLLVVQSGDLVLTLVGWEVMGWCSYLLIGHVSERESARRAAHKAFLVTRVADIGFILGFVVLAVGARSTDLAAVIAYWTGTQPGGGLSAPASSALLTLALVGIVVGVAGKSGLVPFHDWLPDAMEGPTPASALIHAATMVAAGTYVIARLHPMYALDGGSRALLGVLAALTMVWAALLAFAQSDVKRMLAYSTLSQVALMASALAFSGPVPGGVDSGADPSAVGLAHLFSHALFKSLLFLAIGWLSVVGGGTAFVALRGRAHGRGALPWSIAIGLGALAGVPPLVGFFSKEGLVTLALEQRDGNQPALAWLVTVALVMTVVLTAAYCTRAWLLLTTTSGGDQSASDGGTSRDALVEELELARVEAESGQLESGQAAASAGDDLATATHGLRPVGRAVEVTVSALAVLTVVGVVFLVPLTGSLHVGVPVALVTLVALALTFVIVRAAARGSADPAARLGARWQAGSERGFGADSAYVAVGHAVLAVARLVVTLDRDVVDAYPRGAAGLTGMFGRAAERAHRGTPSAGLVAVVVGIVVVAVLGVTAWH